MAQSQGREDERLLFEQFVVSGLDDSPEPLSPSSQECGCRSAQPLAPIIDICIIFPTLGESMPDDYTMIETTPLGYPADLNHGSIRMPSCFLGYRRGYQKPPLVDIGILDPGRGDKPMIDINTLKLTPYGRSANVNNASQQIFLTYRRAPPNSAPSQFVVTDICVILSNKGEVPPHTFYKIPKNLNKGMVGSDVYLCYKKSQGSSKRLAYKPTVLDYFPRSITGPNSENEFKLAQNIPMFCLPMGALIECWPAKCQPPDKSFTTFVLTDENGTKYYGAAVAFFEKYTKPLSDEQLEKLDMAPSCHAAEGGAVEDSSSNNDPADLMDFYTNVAICLISRYPFFHSFKRFLYYIHRMSQGSASYSVPIERYLSHLRYEVSFPTFRRPRVLMSLGAETISFDSHEDNQLPLNGAQLYDALRSLGADNLMYLMLLALLEQKILVHSLRSWLLTAVSESVCALMFPFHWQCPYVPQCPLGLAGVLHAPLPFIAGVDSRYFELYEDPPPDVTCFDLDTSTVSFSSVRQTLKLAMLPKKASKQLKTTLEDLSKKISVQNYEISSGKKSGDFVPVEQDFQLQKKRKEIETEIQEAFLRFMSYLMAGYQSYLRPIKCAPASVKATDTGNLFDLAGFLRSRDKSGAEFFRRFCETQTFMRFVEERSFISDKNAYNAFFDDCMAKQVAAENSSELPSLIDADVTVSETHPSVFIAPPEPIIDAETGEEQKFLYSGFPRKLNNSLYQLDQLNINMADSQQVPVQHDPSRCAAVRTKPEIRSSYMAAVNAVRTNRMHWPKTLLFYAYSLWFMQLPSLVALAPNKKKILLLAFNVIERMENSRVALLDQVCYRILIQLCGDNNEPTLAVKVLQAMQRAGLEQNAVTYGIYHRAVMNAQWPSETRQKAINAWSKLRGVVFGAYQFKLHADIKLKPSMSPRRSTPDSSTKAEDETSIDTESDAPYTISYHPLPKKDGDAISDNVSVSEAECDPLGAISSKEQNRSETTVERLTMSPSRAKFLADHSAMPFANDTTPKQEAKSSNWLKGITKNSPFSPFMKMLRSQTFESPKDVENGQMTMSPSFHNLVNQVRKGYDDVVKEGVSSKLRHGVSSLVQEVKTLNKSYSNVGNSADMSTPQGFVNDKDPAYQLDSGHTGTLLPEAWWLSEVLQQMRRSSERERAGATDSTPDHLNSSEDLMEITISTCTPCPNCRRIVYDEEIMAGWLVDDQNLNTACPRCCPANCSVSEGDRPYVFTPRMLIEFRRICTPAASWYPLGGLNPLAIQSSDEEQDNPSPICVAFISPLALRRELETVVGENFQCLKDKGFVTEQPVLFWNMIYYLRRLGLPSHLPSFIATRHHIRIVYDRPALHQPDQLPLYFFNPINKKLLSSVNSAPRNTDVWRVVTTAVSENKLFTAMQALINNSRRITDDNKVVIGPHFQLFRDIQFASIDLFGRALVRDSLDTQFPNEFDRLPVRIRNLLDEQDYPQLNVQRACRKIFMPLDLL